MNTSLRRTSSRLLAGLLLALAGMAGMLSPAAGAAAPQAAPTGRVLVIGDSIAWGYASQVVAPKRVVNKSIPGSCLFAKVCSNPDSGPLIRRLRATTIRPGDVVVVAIGTNDLGDGRMSQYSTAYRQAVRYIRAQGAQPLVATITPFGGELLWGRAEMDELRQKVNAWILRTMPALDLSTVLGGKHMPDRFNGGDGLHPNPAGSERLARAVTVAVARLGANA